MNYTDLSRAVSHALRHEPWLYELELDDSGWVSVSALLEALRVEKLAWANLTTADLAEMIERSSKKRHELRGDKIRALYGHSTPHRLSKEEAQPPFVLFHGTSAEASEVIKKVGLKPMGRQYVHLSVDKTTAEYVARRKTELPLILRVMANEAYRAGVRFYSGNDLVWLADFVPPKFIA